MGRGLRLERLGTRRPNFWRDAVVRTRIRVVETFGDVPAEVFVFERRPVNSVTGDIEDLFQSVASPVDLTLFPVDAPDPQLSDAFFRKSFVEVDLYSQEEFDQFWSLLSTHVCALLDALDATDRMGVKEEVGCGT